MTTKLETHAARTRCHECGSTEITATCHHCGKPLCGNHLRTRLDAHGKPLSKEFADLELEKSGPPQHCAEHDHVVLDDLRKYLFVGGGAAVLGILLLGLSVTIGLLLAVAGAATAGIAYHLGRQRASDAARNRQSLPVVPSVDSVKFAERLRGRFVLGDDGSYQTTVTPVTGELEFAMTLGRQDRDRLDLYRRKYRLAQHEPIAFSAGFAVLEGPVALRFHGLADRTTVVPLGGHVAEQPFFTEPDNRAAAQWRVRLTHDLRTTPEVDFIPVWLTPTLVPSSDRRALELDVQWLDLKDKERHVVFERIESLRIAVPIGWGNVQGAAGRPTVGTSRDDRGEPVRTIEWTRISAITSKDRDKRRIRLQVQFERQIALTDTISGQIEVTFAGALSGVRAVHIHHPLGNRRGDVTERELSTVVSADFELSLAGVRYQDMRLVPDRQKPNDETRVGKEVFKGIRPNHGMVIGLTNAMADDGYYVKCAVEIPQGVTGAAGVVNRDWEIAGRRYDGVYPVDFRVLLTGEDVDGPRRSGATIAEITVQGAHASEAMEARIEREWEQLRALVVSMLQQEVPPEREPVAFVPPLQNSHDLPRPSVQRRDVLNRRREDAQDALMAGRISEAAYREIVDQLERELRDL